DNKNLCGICGYAKSKLEERAERKRPRRLDSEIAGVVPRKSTGKLHKPPQVRAASENVTSSSPHTVTEKPRNRLRKQNEPPTLPHTSEPAVDLFILEYESYPTSSEPGKVLGVYSTLNSVTSGAFAHGAYTFSREGLLHSNEYLSLTGRIKLARTAVQRTGVRAFVPERSDSLHGESVRLDIPHPEPNERHKSEEKLIMRDAVFLAVRTGPQAASWIGVFADKSLAWGACLKDKAMCAVSGTLCDEARTIGDNNMPQITGRLIGSGHFTWMVDECVIDDSRPTPKQAVRDV
ncbi:hypothetical protein CC86DRAFT_289263, partial [Ophiobolus disseminans]